MDDAIVMDKETFKLLASDTRISILKLLRKRDYNLSEISKHLNLSKSTVKEHMDLLVKSELVKDIDRGKWKYYSLTKHGHRLVGEDQDSRNVKRVVIVLSTIIFAVLGLFLFIGFISQMTLSSSEPTMFVQESFEDPGTYRDLDIMPTVSKDASESEGFGIFNLPQTDDQEEPDSLFNVLNETLNTTNDSNLTTDFIDGMTDMNQTTQ